MVSTSKTIYNAGSERSGPDPGMISITRSGRDRRSQRALVCCAASAMSRSKASGSRPKKERYSVNAVDSALVILGAVAEHGVIGLADATRAAGVSKSTAFRLLATLSTAGLVEQNPDGGYRTGQRALQWAGQILARVDLR